MESSEQVGSCTGVSAHPTIGPRLLTPVREAMMAAERRATPASPRFPYEPATDEISSLREETTQLAGPVFVQRVGLVGLGDADDHPASFRPGHGTVLLGSAQREGVAMPFCQTTALTGAVG